MSSPIICSMHARAPSRAPRVATRPHAQLLLEPVRNLLVLTNVRVVDKHLQMQGVRIDTLLPLLELLDARLRRIHTRAATVAKLRPELEESNVLHVFASALSVLETTELSAFSRFREIESETKLEREQRMAGIAAAGVPLSDANESGLRVVRPSAAQLAAALERRQSII
jgi:hypothetical protein